jgi:hypothetical protein
MTRRNTMTDSPPDWPAGSDTLTLLPGEADPRSAARLRAWSDDIVDYFGGVEADPGTRRDTLPRAIRGFVASATPDQLRALIDAAGFALMDRLLERAGGRSTEEPPDQMEE